MSFTFKFVECHRLPGMQQDLYDEQESVRANLIMADKTGKNITDFNSIARVYGEALSPSTDHLNGKG